MKLLELQENEIVFKQGDKSDALYFVKSGLIGIEAGNGNKRTEIAQIGKGQFLGEMGMIENAPRSADAVVIDKATLLRIVPADFPEFVRDNTDDVVTMMKNLSARLRETTDDFCRLLGIIRKNETEEGFLSEITALWKRLVGDDNHLEKMPKNKYRAGEILFEQGDVGTVMFRVISGEADIIRNYGKKDEKLLATVGKGAIFGETAVVEKERRTATLIAKTDLEVITVANVNLATFLHTYPEEAMRILVGLSSKLRNTTKEYVTTLEEVSRLAKTRGTPGDYAPYVDRYYAMAEFYPEGMDQMPIVISPYHQL